MGAHAACCHVATLQPLLLQQASCIFCLLKCRKCCGSQQAVASGSGSCSQQLAGNWQLPQMVASNKCCQHVGTHTHSPYSDWHWNCTVCGSCRLRLQLQVESSSSSTTTTTTNNHVQLCSMNCLLFVSPIIESAWQSLRQGGGRMLCRCKRSICHGLLHRSNQAMLDIEAVPGSQRNTMRN